jgi:uncharacterized protein YhfF
MTDPKVEKYWNTFLKTLPADSPYHGKTYTAEWFGDNPELADELGQLVLSGIKTGTCSAVWEWEAEGNPIPEVGFVSITLNGQGEPICMLETTEITLRRYNEVDEEFARSEGEGDLTLRYWREAHKNFFSRTLPKVGREFSEDMPLVCETFRVIYK